MDAFNEYIHNRTVQIIAGCVLILLIAFGGYKIVANRSNTQNENGNFQQVGDNKNVDVIDGDNGVIVKDQEPGNKVVISEVVLEQPAWVAIADDDNGKPGRILGAQLFGAGKTAGSVDLLRSTVSGKSYFAVVRKDAGVPHKFEITTDIPLMNDAGDEMIVSHFTTNISK